MVSNRRDFIFSLSKVIGSSLLLTHPILSSANNLQAIEESITVGDVISGFLKEIPGAPFNKTVDTLKAGSLDLKVKGILTSAFATIENIRKAIDIGANFIIAHEPTFYNHQDAVDWLKNDEVYQYKARLLEENNIAVWRNHDYIHSHSPDGVITALVDTLGWDQYRKEGVLFELPAQKLQGLIEEVKVKLNTGTVRYIGKLNQTCRKILLLPGAPGGTRQIEAIGKYKPDAVLIGESNEWETIEYVRDANDKGQNLAMVVLGHIGSEDIGSKWMAEWIKKKFPAITVSYHPTTKPLHYI